MCVCLCVHACWGEGLAVCVLCMRGGFGLWVMGMGINWGQKVWVVGVCVCVRMCLFSENWRALKQALGNQKRI